MRILLDECVSRKLALYLPDFEVETVQVLGWSGVKNGKLLTLAVENNFDVFLTIDKNLRFQQNMEKHTISVVVFDIVRGKLSFLRLLLPKFQAMGFNSIGFTSSPEAWLF